MKMMAVMAVMMGFAFSLMAASGETDNASITGKATVIQAIDVANITNLEFGTVSPGLAKTIDLENVATGGQVGEGTETTGVFSVSAAASSDVSIQFTTLPTALDEDGDGTATLPIGTYTAGYHTANPYSGGTTFTAGDLTQLYTGNFPTNDVSGTNLIYVFLGGTVTPGAAQTPGTYQGSITLTATYN